MPRSTSVPTTILLAPTVSANPLEPVNDVEESRTKDAEIQTMYRESEAQTVPYAPSYTVRPGESPNVLLMAGFSYCSGLPMGPKEAQMVEFAMLKRDLELSMPPFTDEASLSMRKRLMEQQEVREMKLRENEIDAQREARMELLERALADREETAEFATAQRVESLRVKLLEERERKLQQVRNKRVKVLRRLAQARSKVDPLLSDAPTRDIINEYFDKGSSLYAPRVREGKASAADSSKLDASSRIATLAHVDNVAELERSLPADLAAGATASMFSTSKSGTSPARTHAHEERLTSAAQRAVRNAKKDVEAMSKILANRKKATRALGDQERPRPVLSMPQETSGEVKAAQSRGRVRPPTPDLTRTRDEQAVEQQEEYASAVILLQRLIRGRASQNSSYEGRFRRAALIKELRDSTEELAATEATSEELGRQSRAARELRIRGTSIDAALGGTSSTLIAAFAEEHLRLTGAHPSKQGPAADEDESEPQQQS